MSRNGTLLPVSGVSELVELDALVELWPSWAMTGVSRSRWLGEVEDVLRRRYPSASSADLRLTARSIAPFPLAAGHNVP